MAPTNNGSRRTHIIQNLLQFEIATNVTAALNAQNSKKFCHFYTEMLCTGCDSHRRRDKSNNAEENLQNFTIPVPLSQFCARQPILRKLAYSAQNYVRAESH